MKKRFLELIKRVYINCSRTQKRDLVIFGFMEGILVIDIHKYSPIHQMTSFTKDRLTDRVLNGKKNKIHFLLIFICEDIFYRKRPKNTFLYKPF